MTITAKIIADSIGEHSPRLVTVQCRYPKFIHGEVMTHRVFSRNASSSRAIPVARLIQDVIDDPVYPSFWGKNQAGMQAREECNTVVELSGDMYWGADPATREIAWDVARDNAIHVAKEFAAAGYHKQIVNRLLEPFCHINTLITSTQWSNFLALRDHADAQPEIRLLAIAIREAMAESSPVPTDPGQYHLPYVSADEERSTQVGDAIGLSVARCARVSYLTQDGKVLTREEDMALYRRLLSSVPLHASPAEHQASPDKNVQFNLDGTPHEEIMWARPELHGNLTGWCQFRKMIPGECQ